MSDKDKETFDVWQAALTHAAQKDAEIKRVIAGRDYAEEKYIKCLGEIERLKRVIFLMADKLEAHGEKFNDAEFDAALSVAQQEG